MVQPKFFPQGEQNPEEWKGLFLSNCDTAAEWYVPLDRFSRWHIWTALLPARTRPEEDIRKDLSTGDNEHAEMMRKGVPGGEKYMSRSPEVGMGQMCTDTCWRKQTQGKLLRIRAWIVRTERGDGCQKKWCLAKFYAQICCLINIPDEENTGWADEK